MYQSQTETQSSARCSCPLPKQHKPELHHVRFYNSKFMSWTAYERTSKKITWLLKLPRQGYHHCSYQYMEAFGQRPQTHCVNFGVVVCGGRSWTWWPLWILSSSGHSMILCARVHSTGCRRNNAQVTILGSLCCFQTRWRRTEPQQYKTKPTCIFFSAHWASIWGNGWLAGTDGGQQSWSSWGCYGM